ncbi:RNA-binding protein 27-like [Arapaima gigas]
MWKGGDDTRNQEKRACRNRKRSDHKSKEMKYHRKGSKGYNQHNSICSPTHSRKRSKFKRMSKARGHTMKSSEKTWSHNYTGHNGSRKAALKRGSHYYNVGVSVHDELCPFDYSSDPMTVDDSSLPVVAPFLPWPSMPLSPITVLPDRTKMPVTPPEPTTTA